MQVHVIYHKECSAVVSVEVPDNISTEERIDLAIELAKAKKQDSDWQVDFEGIVSVDDSEYIETQLKHDI